MRTRWSTRRRAAPLRGMAIPSRPGSRAVLLYVIATVVRGLHHGHAAPRHGHGSAAAPTRLAAPEGVGLQIGGGSSQGVASGGLARPPRRSMGSSPLGGSGVETETEAAPTSFEATIRGVAVKVSSESSLRSSLLRAGVSPHNGNAKLVNCRGLGTCGTCALLVEEGDVLPQEHTAAERLRLSLPPHSQPASKRLRLACQVRPNSDLGLVKFTGFWGQHIAAGTRSDESADEFKTYFGELEHAFERRGL